MAYKKVVVPLDGSKLAEIALPHAIEIAQGCNIPQIDLVSVTESMKALVPRSEVSESLSPEQYKVTVGQVDGFQGRMYLQDSPPLMKVPVVLGRMAKSARTYLLGVAEDLEKKGVEPAIAVLVGNPAEQIVQYAEDEGADLIVMASHGRSGVSHWAVGSVAEKVFRATDIPVLLVKPKAGFKETKPRRRGKPA
jgi:nucleotide-binding universal stress UspA family protein